MVRCVSCSASEEGSTVRGRGSRKGPRSLTATWHKTSTCGDVHERLFSLSRRKKCCCQAVAISADTDTSDDINCTFSPTVNRTHDALLLRWAEGVNVFERLYGNALFLQKKREWLRGPSAPEQISHGSNCCNAATTTMRRAQCCGPLSSRSSFESSPASSVLSPPAGRREPVRRGSCCRIDSAGIVVKRSTLMSPLCRSADITGNPPIRHTRATMRSRGARLRVQSRVVAEH